MARRHFDRLGRDLSQTALEHHDAVISGTLKRALKKGLIVKDLASLVDNRRTAPEDRNEATIQCWTAEEAKRFLSAARELGTQPATFYSFALENGMRKGEICGLPWSNVDLAPGKVLVDCQLVRCARHPVYGPSKRGRARTISLSSETNQLPRDYRKAQNDRRLKNRSRYEAQGFVFAKEWAQMGSPYAHLGDPLQPSNIGQREFADITQKAKVRKIKSLGLRHTCATLLLRVGIPVHPVSERLRRQGIEITLNIYAHVLPDQQEDAAKARGSLLHTCIFC